MLAIMGFNNDNPGGLFLTESEHHVAGPFVQTTGKSDAEGGLSNRRK